MDFSGVFNPRNIAALLLVAGQALLKWGTPDFTWGSFALTLTVTVMSWFGISQQAAYNTERLRLERAKLGMK